MDGRLKYSDTRFKRRALFSVLLCLFALSPLFAQNHVGGIIQDTVWIADYSPYIVVDDILIESGHTLTIEPGVEILFQQDYVFQVSGTLISSGNMVDSIFFASADPSLIKWHGIVFDGPLSANSTLEYCSIKDVTHGVTCQGSDIAILNCTIESTFMGIYSFWSAPTIIGDSITVFMEDDGTGIVIGIKLSESQAIIEECYIEAGNPNVQTSVMAYGVRSEGNSEPQIRLISNRIISWAKGKSVGVHLANSSKDSIRYNEIISLSGENYVKAGLLMIDCSGGFITNNTLVVESPYKDVTMLFQNYSYDMKIINNILYGDGSSDGAVFENSYPIEMIYNDFYAHQHNVIGITEIDPSNIFEDPLFAEIYPDSMYYLARYSPCIDSGHPSNYFNDPDNTRGDIGAHFYYYVVNVSPELPVSYKFVKIYPNPTNSSTTILLNLTDRSKVSLRAYDVLGRFTASIYDGYLNTGVNVIDFNMSNIASGTYFIVSELPASKNIQKLVLIK